MCIVFVKSLVFGVMVNYFGLEGIFQQMCYIVDFFMYYSVVVFNKIRFMVLVICSQWFGWWVVLCMQMYVDFCGVVGNYVFGEFDIKGVDGYFIVG